MNAALHALSDPTRRAILARLAKGEATPSDLARPFAMSQPAISQHLKVLEAAGLIRRRVDGQRRPCRLAPEGLAELETWLARLRAVFDANYNRLDALLDEMEKTDAPDDAPAPDA